MPLLDALLAFALTMLALASVATLLVELVHRIGQLRAKGLRGMLERIYDQELRPLLAAELAKLEGAAEDVKQRFLREILENPLAESRSLQPALRSLERMSTEEFLRRLGDTEAGALLRQRLGARAAEIGQALDRLARRFDHYGAVASDFFARRAKVLSVAAGIGLAFICNVDAVRILNGYLQDSVAAQAVIAQSDVFLEQWREARESLAAFERSSGGSDGSDLSDRSDGGGDLAAVAARLAQVRDSLGDLEGTGLPVGYDRYPVTVDLGTWKFWSWAFIVLLTGFLLGLGGPFWFDVVMRLSQVRQALRGGVRAGPGSPPEAPAAVTTAAAAPQ
jgi:hypothetical protein